MPKSSNKEVRYRLLDLLKNKYSAAKYIEKRLIIWSLVYRAFVRFFFLEKILRWDRLCANKSISIFHCNSVLFSQASNFYMSVMKDTDHKELPVNGVHFRDSKVFWLGSASGRSLHQNKLYQKEMVVTFLQFAGKI